MFCSWHKILVVLGIGQQGMLGCSKIPRIFVSYTTRHVLDVLLLSWFQLG